MAQQAQKPYSREWLDPQPVIVHDSLRAAVGGHPLVAEIMARRGLIEPKRALAFLDPSCYSPAPPSQLPDMEAAVARLRQALEEGQRIWIWGDFDVDGQTATAVLEEGLRNLGASVRYYIPSRHESHGLNLPALERILANGAQLIVTCDTGVTAHREIAFCQGQGVDVIVTDHHDLPERLPDALAVVNPKRLPEGHPLRELTGVGCAYELMAALYAELGLAGQDAEALDLVALGLVGDVATLTGDARYLVQVGLRALRRTTRPGLRAVMEFAHLEPAGLTEEHIAFVLAPRFNALGRLDDATPGVELLTTRDLTQARTIASVMEGLNDQRKLMVKQLLEAAEEQIAKDSSLAMAPALVIAQKRWPSGLIGVVAGRLAERHGKPAIVITVGDDGVAQGSARSVPGCDIHAAIAKQGAILQRFGGHPMAAGFSLDAERVPEFRQGLLQAVAEMTQGERYLPELQIDAYLRLSDVTLELALELERLAPFGPGNPAPCFAVRGVRLTSEAVIGITEEHRRLVVEDAEGETRSVLQWHSADTPLPHGTFDLAFTLRAAGLQGEQEAQMEWLDARELEVEQPLAVEPKIEVIDYRQVSNAEQILRDLLRDESVQVWGEGANMEAFRCRGRHELSPGPALVIWTVPPSSEVLSAALDTVRPERVYLFGRKPEPSGARELLQRLAGLAKHALVAASGRVRIVELAAATAQREDTVRTGLRWLADKGQIDVIQQGEEWMIRLGDRQPSPTLPQTEAAFVELLEETKAYREYYLRADAQSLISHRWRKGNEGRK